MQTDDEYDIEYTETPGGFSLQADLTSYWAIPPLVLCALPVILFWTRTLRFPEPHDVRTYASTAISLLMYALCCIFALVRLLGTFTLRLDYSKMSVSSGFWIFKWTKEFDFVGIRMISEVVRMSNGLPYSLICVERNPQSPGATGKRVLFGQMLNLHQRLRVISILRQWQVRAA